MTSVRALETFARRQEGVVARWQLIDTGWDDPAADRALIGLQRLEDGVYLTGYARPSPLQRWWAATLTAPRTVLSHESAACCWELREVDPRVRTVVRPGRTSPRMHGAVYVRYSATLEGNVTRRRGLWITTPERTVIDLWGTLRGRHPERLLRDAVRLKLTRIAALQQALDLNTGRRGIATLRERCELYVRLPLDRCRSDAEVEGLVVLDRAGVELPAVNVRRAGEEADFSWEARRLIVEVDGDSFHQDKLEDARKTGVWTRAGWTVHRVSSDDVYLRPQLLIAAAMA